MSKNEQTDDFYLKVLKLNGEYLKDIKNQTKEMCLTAVRQNGYYIRYVKDQTEEVRMAAAQDNGYSVQFMKKPSKKVRLAAVKNNGLSLSFIKKQTEEICLAAVNENGDALQYVADQNLLICLTAVKNSPFAIQYVNINNADLDYNHISKVKVLKIEGGSLKSAGKKYIDTLLSKLFKIDGMFDSYEYETENITLNKICLEAVKGSGLTLSNCKILTDEIILTAILDLSNLNKYSAEHASGVIDYTFYNYSNRMSLVKCEGVLYEAINNILKNGSEDLKQNFYKDQLSFCLDIISAQGDEYILNLRSKIPDVFDNSIALSSMYEQIILKKSIDHYNLDSAKIYKKRNF